MRLKTKININQACIDEGERQRRWEEERRFPLYYFQNRFQWFNYPRWFYVAPFPLHVDFEASSRCNLTCPMCFRRHFKKEHAYVDMDFDLYRKGINECAANNLYSIRLSWRGESTLNPMLIDMIEYARKAGIKEISLLSNGSALSKDFDMKLIKAGLDYITISIDSLREHYNNLRTPLSFDDIYRKVKQLYELKERFGKGFPKVKVQGIYEYTKGKLREYYEMFKPITDNISFNIKHDYHLRSVEQDEEVVCQFLWQRITITSTGLIPVCIADWDIDIPIGNLKENTIKEVWLGEKMESLRRLHMEKRRLEMKPCRTCHRYKDAVIDEVIEG